MVRLREIPRTASFAWSPGAAAPLIATGTRVGAVDADFSNKTCLELWDLDLDCASASTSEELQPVAKIDTDSGFNDLAWAEFEDNTRGVIAGALENGSLDLWDADKLLGGASDPLVSRVSKHSGTIKALQFNPRHSNLLATGGAKGELYISDLNNLQNPFRLGGAARVDDIECLDWNKKVAHILVTGSNAGFVTIWDVKSKKESLTLNNMGRKAVSAVAWDPERPTKLVTSTPLESDPMIFVWDLRNSHVPERTLKGHESGVLSLSWCDQDPDLLLSSGKDNRTVCWNPQTGQAYGEFPVVTNWTFQTRWSPHNPNFFGTASFDGRISIQTIQSTHALAEGPAVDQDSALDGEDFFAKAQTQPQVSTFSLPKAPRWLERPCTASFGFGGRVISVGLAEKGKRISEIKVTPFEVDETVGSATETFENALKEGDLRSLCELRSANAASDEEKADWKVMKALISDEPRKGLVEYLGFQDQAEDAADALAKLGLNNDSVANGQAEKGPRNSGKKHKRLQSMFDGSPEGDNFLSDLSASKGARINDPFHIFSGSESDAEKEITRALLLGNFENALNLTLKEGRMSDAFMIAICGGEKCIKTAQEYYFSKHVDGPNYIRLLASIAGKNLWDVVHNADLSNWKEIMAALCTFADEKEFADLCDALGDRLEAQVETTGDKAYRKDASLCFLAGSKLEKVVTIWIEELRENEKKGIEAAADSSIFSIHVRALQGLIEKVTIFRQVAGFQDAERTKESDWKLSNLYDKYIEYADVVATHGRLQIAQKYLDLVPEKHPEAEVARNRIRLAMRQTTPQKTQAAASAIKPAKHMSHQPGFAMASPAAASAQGSYASAAPQPVNPYAPPAIPGVSPVAQSTAVPTANPYSPLAGGAYAPTGYQPPQGLAYGVSKPSIPPPPRASTQSPSSMGSYANASNLPSWNDLPENFVKPVTSRRGTPATSAAPISSPFPNQSLPEPHGPPPPGVQRIHSVPPPPKGTVPPPRIASPSSIGHMAALSVTAASPPPPNPYASLPQPAAPQMGIPPPAARGPSPYNAQPTAPPPPNRYTPNPAAQAANLPAQPRTSVSRPPPATSSIYAPQQAVAVSHHTSATPPPTQRSIQQGHQQVSRPGTATPHKESTVPLKYPPGDRSHIPPNAMPIYEILSADMQRVKARAPSTFKPQVEDAERRLNILFDRLNNEDLLKPNTVADMVELSRAIQSRDYDTAQNLHIDIMTNRMDECGNWMVGVKRLISMSKATP